MPSEHLTTRWTSSRVVLVATDEARLTNWMGTHLAVTVAIHDGPVAVEAAVIRALSLPLNLAGNNAHPAYPLAGAARATWRSSAGPRPSPVERGKDPAVWSVTGDNPEAAMQGVLE